MSKRLSYEVQVSADRRVLWVHASDGSTVGRFGRMGVDIHTSVADQLAGASQCRVCTHGPVSKEDWALFKEKAQEFWGIELAEDLLDLSHLT